jgi:hypothetical protein
MPTPPGWRVADEEVVSELLPQVAQRRAQGVVRLVIRDVAPEQGCKSFARVKLGMEDEIGEKRANLRRQGDRPGFALEAQPAEQVDSQPR